MRCLGVPMRRLEGGGNSTGARDADGKVGRELSDQVQRYHIEINAG